ncbi:MAG: thiamine phosphate synthase [Proteobacteria bacterium]|nr:thiamine phosphate synthase [Pseudomonadota bacterium]
MPAPPLLVITDRRQARRSLEETVAAALAGGARWISLREKDFSSAERVALLKRLVALGRGHGAIVMVHEDIDAACEAGADGVHLPSGGDPAAARRRLGPGALIGVSTHSLAAAELAAAAGADYVTFSPIFASASKPDYGPALGPPALAALTQRVAIPVIALGGVTAANAADCLAAGAAGVAVMGPIMRADDPAALTAALLAALER